MNYLLHMLCMLYHSRKGFLFFYLIQVYITCDGFFWKLHFMLSVINVLLIIPWVYIWASWHSSNIVNDVSQLKPLLSSTTYKFQVSFREFWAPTRMIYEFIAVWNVFLTSSDLSDYPWCDLSESDFLQGSYFKSLRFHEFVIW